MLSDLSLLTMHRGLSFEAATLWSINSKRLAWVRCQFQMSSAGPDSTLNVPGVRVGRLNHALDSLRHLARREVVDHVPGAVDELQHAARNVIAQLLGPALEHDLIAVTCDDNHWQS